MQRSPNNTYQAKLWFERFSPESNDKSAYKIALNPFFSKIPKVELVNSQ